MAVQEILRVATEEEKQEIDWILREASLGEANSMVDHLGGDLWEAQDS